MNQSRTRFEVRNTRTADFGGITELCKQTYPDSPPWSPLQLASHLELFPEGQFVAIESATGQIVGMAASLIILWNEYDSQMDWSVFTANGMFTNHDPKNGRTLYGAEIMVKPTLQRSGIGKKIYQARREITERLGLLRIRAGARLRGYHRYAHRMTAEEYVIRVVHGKVHDPTLTFQLKQGFHVLGVTSGYLHFDPASRGFAAIIEWINQAVASPEDYAGRDPRFVAPPSSSPP